MCELEQAVRTARPVRWPGELAEFYDDGPTIDYRDQTRRIDPVRLLDADEQPTRAAACADLGLDPSEINVFVAPGSGNNFPLNPLCHEAIEALRGVDRCRTCVAEWMISDDIAESNG